MDKATRYKWEIVDEPGTLMWIDKRQIKVDHKYQRDVIKSKVSEMSAGFSWIGFGALSVADRNGEYYAMDGQNRLAAAMNFDNINQVPCVVFKVSDKKSEALGFIATNLNRKPVTSYAKFRALVVAENPTALFVSRLFDKYQLKVAETDGPSSIRAVGRVMDLARLDQEKFRTVFDFCYQLCYPTAQISKIIIDVIDYIHTHVENEGKGINDKALAKRILSIGPEAIMASATRAAAIMGKATTKIYTMGVMEAVNKNLHHKYSLDTIA